MAESTAAKKIITNRKPKVLKRKLSKKQLTELYYYMILNRALDDRISSLYKQGKFQGGAFVSRGQEATSVGSAYALEKGDVIGPMIRNSGAVLVRGVPPHEFLANYLGKKTGPTHGKDGNSHFGDLKRNIFAPVSMLGVLIPVCAGAALAFRIKKEANVALTWIGDGGASIGDFHEGLNFAAVMKLPFVLILENNGYAYSTPTSKQSLVEDFVVRAQGYGIPGEIVDGNDVLAVYEVTKRAVERARKGEGPTLIEAKTFRMKGHAEHDDAFYVPKKTIDYWQKRDPIANYEKYLLKEKVLAKKDLAEIQSTVAKEIDAAQTFAEESPLPLAEEAEQGVYAS
ncbi:MAG: thiamine pyrophosphate-dependent dehydrogenase E1 component subunit alpha [Caldithrix sp.]|nr:MAG: thiamine pyrophosphate-dependent dehydrogenase E1 component subunit alpha [Caldithrix sp.]